MRIPASVSTQVKKDASPLENAYFLHAEASMGALEKVTQDSYCCDHVAMAINTLERAYKGLLQAAVDHCDCYQLPNPKFLTADHDILGMVMEIKRAFPDFFPYQDRSQWRETKLFLKDLRSEYTKSRYSTYPSYDEFCSIRNYTRSQIGMVSDYVKEGNLTRSDGQDYNLDY